MNNSSESNKKIKIEKYNQQQGSAPNQQEKRIPNASIIKSIQQSIDYMAMWKAIQKIAKPVSFESLKRFYKIGQ